MLYSILTFICWGTADLFYKKGNIEEGKYNYLKTGLIVGLVMGIHATIYILVKHLYLNLFELIKYLPVSLCYIASMVISYKGFKYIELSIASPIENTSGVITSLLLIIFFKEKLPTLAYIGMLFVFIGIVMLSIIEKQEDRRVVIRKLNLLIIIFPLLYCFLDGLGTFLDAIYLDKLSLISEDSALICYEYTFLIYAVITYIYLRLKKEKLTITHEKNKVLAAVLETAGQFFYVFAMANDSTISATIVGSYCILSLILSHIFLKEKLVEKKYIALIIALSGLFILTILNI